MPLHDELLTHEGGNYKTFKITPDKLPEIQGLIREKLVAICYGYERVLVEPDQYTYKQACSQLHVNLQRYSDEMKYGLVGELLMHVLAPGFLGFRAESISMILALQNQNVKPGFDLNFHDPAAKKVWYGEVKSGLNHADRKELVVRSRDGLRTFFDNIGSTDPKKATSYRWEAAKNEVINMFASRKRAALSKLLTSDRDSISSNTGRRRNAILMTVNFGSESFNNDGTQDIDECITNINQMQCFDDFTIISAHKELFDDVIDFLANEASNDV